MPTPNRATSSGSRQLTDQELLTEVWAGKKTGNLFKATDVTVEEGVRQISYRKSTGEAYKISYDSFVSRFRPATTDDMWQQLETVGAGQDGENISDLVTVVEPDHRHDLNRMILYPDCRTEIQVGLNRIMRAEAMEATWALSQIEPRANRCVLNFYGAPGTGKTLAAVAVAKLLGKKLLKVDYAEIVSKYPGDTAKHIKMVFKIARESDAALMFDEADSLLSRRLNFSDSVDGASVTSINQNRNTLLSQVDEFDGVVIMCTNFFSNYDEAFLRRIARHVEFKLPNAEMRQELFKLHLPRLDKVTLTPDQWAAISNQSVDFSGGDILNVVVNALTRASLPEDVTSWELTHQDLSAEVDSVKRAKTRHGQNGG